MLAQPIVTTRLLDPLGHVAQEILAGSPSANGMFRTLSASSPRAGTWHVDASGAPGAGASPVVMAAQLARPPVLVRLSVAQADQRTKHAITLHFTALVSASGRTARDARVTLQLLIAGRPPIVLHLRAVHRHPGRYTAQTASLKSPTPAVVLARAITRYGTTTSTLQLQPSCP
jgi:hypothetical protein